MGNCGSGRHPIHLYGNYYYHNSTDWCFQLSLEFLVVASDMLCHMTTNLNDFHLDYESVANLICMIVKQIHLFQ